VSRNNKLNLKLQKMANVHLCRDNPEVEQKSLYTKPLRYITSILWWWPRPWVNWERVVTRSASGIKYWGHLSAGMPVSKVEDKISMGWEGQQYLLEATKSRTANCSEPTHSGYTGKRTIKLVCCC